MKKNYTNYQVSTFYRVLLVAGVFFMSHIVSAGTITDQMEKARQYYDKGSFELAIKQLNNVVAQKNNHIEAYKLLGVCYIRTGQYNLALDNFLVAHTLNPQETECLYYKGLCEWRLKRMRSSIESIEKALVYSPDNMLCYKIMGSVFFDIEMMDDAKKYFDKVLGIQSDFEGIIRNVQSTKEIEHNYHVAHYAVTSEIKSQPKEYKNYVYKGILEAANGNYEVAYADLEMANKLHSVPPLVYYYKAYVAYKLKKFDLCMNDLYKYHKHYPDNAEIKGQIEKVKEILNVKNVYVSSENGQLLYFAEQMPEFKGGKTGLVSYLNRNVRFPKTAIGSGVEGKVLISFTIDTVGYIRNAKVEKPLENDCDKEALRVVSAMPQWEPAKQNGRKVSVRYTLPIAFKISE